MYDSYPKFFELFQSLGVKFGLMLRISSAILITTACLAGCSSSTNENSFQDDSTTTIQVPAEPAQGNSGTCFDISTDADCDGISDMFDSDKNGNNIDDRFEDLDTTVSQDPFNGNSAHDNNGDGLIDRPGDNNGDGLIDLPGDNNGDGLIDRPGDNNGDGLIDLPGDNNGDGLIDY